MNGLYGEIIVTRDELEELVHRESRSRLCKKHHICSLCSAVRENLAHTLEKYPNAKYFYLVYTDICCLDNSCWGADTVIAIPAYIVQLCMELDNVIRNTMIMTEAPEARALVEISAIMRKYCSDVLRRH